jgi:hypothetical protein
MAVAAVLSVLGLSAALALAKRKRVLELAPEQTT